MSGWTEEERRAELARREKESVDREAKQTRTAQRPPNAECAICHRPFYSHDPGAEFPICETCD